jgi:hypothetical protein
MKKYKIIYVIIYILLLILVFTRGINIGIEGSSYYDGNIIDGFSESSVILIYNIIIVISIFIFSLIITFIKSNKVKYKSLIFIGVIALLLLVPISIEHRSGGIAGIDEKLYTNILNIPIGKYTQAN